MPLFRYNGCKIRIYRPELVDAVVKFQTCYPMSASQMLYAGTQPGVMMLSKGSHKIPSKKTKPYGKPYRTFRLPPPQQMQNKWYFQSHLAKTGLLLIQTSAASFDEYYISKNAESQAVTLHSLNTKIFQNLNFKSLPTSGYSPKPNFWLWSVTNGTDLNKELIYLGNTIEYEQGKPVTSLNHATYLNNRNNWGNPFHEQYLNKKTKIYFSTIPPAQVIQNIKDKWDQKITLTELTQELYFQLRYNPQTDSGKDTQIYLKSNWKEDENLDPPADTDLIFAGYPIWLE